jgi:putative FmdB family regulatory protein
LPIYEFECSKCSHKFELRRSFNDDSQVLCPLCECNAIRIYRPVPIIFKGSGFYVTDHRSNHGHSEPTTSSSDKAPASVETSSGSKSSDVKPAAGTK